ncbi:LysR family transcriptional regulator [Novacetimonas hansenii]|uniref:LysR family transcriptional regulator n=1 Tax=Novacetimonas hansenii TaxID=436 RepID=UPI00094F4D21|nr:LysR family transcriptional regulator [Novacetimonas hansenii]
MELKWLEDFVCLSRTLSFSRAARERNVSQPAFSKRIRQLEQWAGASLVNRVSYPAELTAEGRRFLEEATEIVSAFYRAQRSVCPSSRCEVVTIAALHTLALTLIPHYFGSRENMPSMARLKVTPDLGGIEDNLNRLVTGGADFFLTYAHPLVPFHLDPALFPFVCLGTERVLPVCAPELKARVSHAMANAEAVDYLSYGDESFFGVALSKLFAKHDAFRRRVVCEDTLSVGLMSMARAGWGVAWLPERLIRDELDMGLLVSVTDDPALVLTVETRLYRHANAQRQVCDQVWDVFTSRANRFAPAHG